MNTSPSPAPIAWAAEFDRLQPGAAQPVDGLAGDLDREPGEQRGHARDVAVVLARLVGAAEDDVLDRARRRCRSARRPRAIATAARSSGRTVGQRPAVAADRGPDRVDDPGLAEGPVQVTRHAPIVAWEPAHDPGVRAPCRSARPSFPVRPIVALGLATVLSVAACAGASSPAAVPASPAASSTAPAEPGSPTVAPSLAADEIQHPTGAADIVLRAATRGGFVRLETVMSRVPEFTLYGDGRVLVLPPDEAATGGGGLNPGAGGGGPVEVPVLGETRLSEDGGPGAAEVRARRRAPRDGARRLHGREHGRPVDGLRPPARTAPTGRSWSPGSPTIPLPGPTRSRSRRCPR